MESFLENFISQKQFLIKSFWAGKLLQELKLSEDGQDKLTDYLESNKGTSSPRLVLHPSLTSDYLGHSLPYLISEAMTSLKVKETSLSPRVHELVTESPPMLFQHDSPCLLECSATLNWSVVSKYILEVAGCILRTNNDSDFAENAKKCKALARHVSQQILEDEALKCRLKDAANFSWTSQPQVYCECVQQLLSSDLMSCRLLRENVVLLKATSVLERSLGDVFLTVSGNKHCPSLLRDLLMRPELDDVFCPAARQLLRCLMGHPSGLNLRNILWHGFADHKEIPSELAVFLLVVVASLGQLLPLQVRDILVTTRRDFLTFPQETILKSVFQDLSLESCNMLSNLFASSFFVLSSMLPTWEAALQAFIEQNYSVAVCLLLVLLEHGLRRVFSCVNKCPQRALTAEADVLYTTFDEILCPLLPDKQPNLFIQEIGPAKMEMLLDLLVHPEGPRVRDRLSHGEVAFSSLTKCMANHVLSLCSLFCVQYSLHKHFTTDVAIRHCLAVESTYLSLFHPFSLLRRELAECNNTLAQWLSIPLPCHHRQESEKCGSITDHLSQATELVQQFYLSILGSLADSTQSKMVECSERGRFDGLVVHVWSSLSTLFVAREQLELVGIMRRIVSHTTRAVGQIRETAACRHQEQERKELRSRQRSNYVTLLTNLPLYQISVEVLMFLIILTMTQLQTDSTNFHRSIKLHKRVLQFSENFYSRTSPSKNCWDEASKLCATLIALLLKGAVEKPTKS